jgi:hypothetical protein
MKVIKFIIGILLIPSCIAATLALIAVLRLLQPDSLSVIPLSAWGFIIGFALWDILYLCLPRPTRTYVFGHELSHLLWAWMLGIEAGRLRVSAQGGSVQVARNHFLITLAPYFFPIYTITVILLRFIVNIFYDTTTYEPFWLGLIGLTWAFHLTFTLSMLKQRQPDIQYEGHLFSYTIIYLFNITGAALWIVLASSIPLEFFIQETLRGHHRVFQWEQQLFHRAADLIEGTSRAGARRSGHHVERCSAPFSPGKGAPIQHFHQSGSKNFTPAPSTDSSTYRIHSRHNPRSNRDRFPDSGQSPSIRSPQGHSIYTHNAPAAAEFPRYFLCDKSTQTRYAAPSFPVPSASQQTTPSQSYAAPPG